MHVSTSAKSLVRTPAVYLAQASLVAVIQSSEWHNSAVPGQLGAPLERILYTTGWFAQPCSYEQTRTSRQQLMAKASAGSQQEHPACVSQHHTWATRPGDQTSRFPTSVKAPPRATHAKDAATMPVAHQGVPE